MSKVSDFTPAPNDDTSARVVGGELKLLPPFTELGFDQLLQGPNQLVENSVTINEAATIGFMCKFGRPLFGTRFKHGTSDVQRNIVDFAASKLRCGKWIDPQLLEADEKLACMAIRLALDFNSTTLKSHERERLQVAKHMRICIKVNDGYETLATVPPSEPILAEAARQLMSYPSFRLPESLLQELQTPGLDKGNRGELICLVLLTLACDKAVAKNRTDSDSKAITLAALFENLLNEDDYNELLNANPSRSQTDQDNRKSFRTTFQESQVYFNHFIKIHDSSVMNQEFLWMLIARGAAVLCADNQAGTDVIVPFAYYNRVLGRYVVSAILIQVKNDRRFSVKPNLVLFQLMDPFFIGIFDPDSTQDPLPVIRMVFALSSATAGVQIIKPGKKNPPRKAKKAKGGKSSFTTYDIWTAGAFSETFSVIRKDQENMYQDLLKVTKTFPKAYESVEPLATSLRRSMHFGSMNDANHWTAFKRVENVG